jgi:23S rRNA pseudouridine1911/1915/1917 synthase
VQHPEKSQKILLPLLDWVLRRHPETPKTRAKQWIVAGRVTVHGVVRRKPHEAIPDPGEALQLLNRQAQALECGSGWLIHPRVALLFLDASLAVVNKGPGLISVPAPNAKTSALSLLADFLSGELKVQHRGPAGKALPPAYRKLEPLPVHRLDQYTSGVFCMATNPSARQHLIEQLKAHTMKRAYVAFVEGRLASPEGTWRNWVAGDEADLRQHIVSAAQAANPSSTAREAITHYRVIAEYPLAEGKFASKLQLKLETGRKHQIRLQAAHAGTPLIGDRTYNPRYRTPSKPAELFLFPRQALHAETLTLQHPDRPGVPMTFTAQLPKDLRQLEANLRAASRAAQAVS